MKRETIAIHGDRGSAVIEQEDVLTWTFSPELPEDKAPDRAIPPRG